MAVNLIEHLADISGEIESLVFQPFAASKEEMNARRAWLTELRAELLSIQESFHRTMGRLRKDKEGPGS